MMGLVRLSLRRPYTTAVLGLLIVLLGILSLSRMIVDIFPVIDIPVVLVVWNYPGLSAVDMERRVVVISERAYSTTVNGIARIESQSIPGIGLLKIYFQPGSDIGSAIAQISAVDNTILHSTPPGMPPPNVIQFNAATVPVVQMTLSSETLNEQQLFDYGLNFIRIKLFTIPGLSSPAPFGGKQRQIDIDVDPARLTAKGLSPSDVVNALQTSNVIVPAGTARIGTREYNISLNSSPSVVQRFEAIPIGVKGGIPVLLGDVARVADSFAVQTNMVHVNGQRASYLAILKHADASTLAVVDATRAILPEIQAAAPKGLELHLDFDQSVFVRAAIVNVVREAVISSVLVSVMILVFLGSWRNTIIVSISIPLSILAAIAGLNITGNTINLMTLGGLALAIGMLVDNATVTVENIHRNAEQGKTLLRAILDGSREVVQPLTVATLAICIVFSPVALLYGPARYLFIPLGVTVVIAMLASYFLSFTVVPCLTRQLLAGERAHGPSPKARRPSRFDRGFQRLQRGYGGALDLVLERRAFVLVCAGLLLAVSLALAPVIGEDFFPTADVGIIKMHFRAPVGTRIENTEKLVLAAEAKIRALIPKGQLRTINDMIGVPVSYNLAFVQTDNVAGMDAEILISLNSPHRPTAQIIRDIRKTLPPAFPGCEIYFQTADIVSQILNFGLSAPIDIQIEDAKFDEAYALGQSVLAGMQKIPGVVDGHIVQVLDYPDLQVDVDRVRAARVGLTEGNVANDLLTSLSSSATLSPSFFLNPGNGINYTVAVQVPLQRVASVPDLMDIPVTPPSGAIDPPLAPVDLSSLPAAPTARLSDIATISPQASIESINHYTVQRVIDVAANIDGRDLGGVAGDLQHLIDTVGKGQPITTHITLRGQNEVMQASFESLSLGLVLAIVLVYALLVILFQSWVDPLIIMMAVPGALIGILWMLALTGTTINVESLMGAIMTVGISVSNSILVVSFANDLRAAGETSAVAAVAQAARTRLRPVLMTALAMIIGMIPMALSLGEAGEQNAPLGRAVIGGLLAATAATLFIVPVMYTLLRRRPPNLHTLDREFAAEADAHGD